MQTRRAVTIFSTVEFGRKDCYVAAWLYVLWSDKDNNVQRYIGNMVNEDSVESTNGNDIQNRPIGIIALIVGIIAAAKAIAKATVAGVVAGAAGAGITHAINN